MTRQEAEEIIRDLNDIRKQFDGYTQGRHQADALMAISIQAVTTRIDDLIYKIKRGQSRWQTF